MKGEKFFRGIGRYASKKYKAYIEKILICSDVNVLSEVFIGFMLVLSSIISLSIFLTSFFILGVSFPWIVFVFLLSFVATYFSGHAIVILLAEKKAKFVEQVIPDALQLMSANIRAGITPDRALLLSARPEFGPLEVEIKRAAKEALAGKPIEEALEEIPKRIGSKTLKRTIRLIREGLKSGGELATLLDETANDVRQLQSIRKEIKANVTMYIIFIFFAAGIGAPLLYAVSSHLVSMMTKIGAIASVGEELVPTAAQIPIKFSAPEVSMNTLFWFCISAIAITTFFGGLILGLIEAGRETAGIRFVVLLLVLGLSVFLIARHLLAGMFGGFI